MSWLSAAQEQAFGKVLADFYIARVPFESPFSAKKFAVKTQDTLKKMETPDCSIQNRAQAERLQKGEAGQLVQVDASRRGV